MNFRLPHTASRLLAWFCPPELYESVAGDLEEQFERDQASVGPRRARWRYAWGVIRFFRPGIVFRNKFRQFRPRPIMIQNYVKVAARNMAKRKFFTIVNALGLGIGIAMCALIWLYIQDEQKFDAFHDKGDRIVRLHHYALTTRNASDSVEYQRSVYLPAPLAQAVVDEIPEVQRATIFNPWSEILLRKGEKMHKETIAFVNQDFLEMFGFRVLAGDPKTALSDKSSIVITESLAHKFFGEADPIGQMILVSIQEERQMVVTAVLEDVPKWSSLNFDVLVLVDNQPFYEFMVMEWKNNSFPHFVELREGATIGQFQRSLDALWDRHTGEASEARRKGLQLDESVVISKIETVALPDLHTSHEIPWPGVTNPMYLWIITCVALLILGVACINYVTLALIGATRRTKEIGVRKALGAFRSSVVGQFWVESFLVTLVAMVISVALLYFFLPVFNTFVEKSISFVDQSWWQVFL